MQTTFDDVAASLAALDLLNLVERACALCCKRRAGVVFKSLPLKARRAVLDDSGISRLVSQADLLGQKPADDVLAPEIARVFRGLTAYGSASLSQIASSHLPGC